MKKNDMLFWANDVLCEQFQVHAFRSLIGHWTGTRDSGKNPDIFILWNAMIVYIYIYTSFFTQCCPSTFCGRCRRRGLCTAASQVVAEASMCYQLQALLTAEPPLKIEAEQAPAAKHSQAIHIQKESSLSLWEFPNVSKLFLGAQIFFCCALGKYSVSGWTMLDFVGSHGKISQDAIYREGYQVLRDKDDRQAIQHTDHSITDHVEAQVSASRHQLRKRIWAKDRCVKSREKDETSPWNQKVCLLEFAPHCRGRRWSWRRERSWGPLALCIPAMCIVQVQKLCIRMYPFALKWHGDGQQGSRSTCSPQHT